MNSLLDQFVALEHRRRSLEAQLQSTKDEIAGIQEPLLEEWGERGQSQAKIDGLTVHLRTDFFCSKAPGIATQTVCDALKKTGLGYMVADGYPSPTLRSKIKEYTEIGGDLPDALSGLLNYGEKTKLATRRS